jgi:cation diffusion facilitator family transporter
MNRQNNDVPARQKAGCKTGLISLLSNLFLFVCKLMMGIAGNSVAVITDGFNNLTDCASSLITIIGFRVSVKGEDEQHPYGHGRMEYITGFIISMIIIGTAFSCGKTAIIRIMHPEQLAIVSWFLLVPMLSIVIKLALALYIRFVNRRMNSAALRATFKDSIADAAITAVTLVALLAAPYTSLPLDGIAGLIVTLVLLWSGISSFSENLNLLLGEGADKELVRRVSSAVLGYDVFSEVTSFAVYDYGPVKKFAFLQVKLNVSPYERVQTAIKELTDLLKQDFNLDATIYWDASHAESEETLFQCKGTGVNFAG